MGSNPADDVSELSISFAPLRQCRYTGRYTKLCLSPLSGVVNCPIKRKTVEDAMF